MHLQGFFVYIRVMTWLTALFEAVKAIFVFSAKVTPSEKIQEERFKIKRVRLEADAFELMLNQTFIEWRRNPEMDIINYVKYKNGNLPDDQEELMISLLRERMIALIRYRRGFPVVYKQWLKKVENYSV